MAFRKKLDSIQQLNPDILIVPECESTEKIDFSSTNLSLTDSFWYGDNPNKGLGIFTFNGYSIEPIDFFNPDFRFIVPLKIRNKTREILLFAIWCQKPEKGDNYGIQTWKALEYYESYLHKEQVLLAGDFNSSSIWDKPKRAANHSSIVEKLNTFNIKSSYHQFTGEEQGKESKPTLFLQRNKSKPYHIDYCFSSSQFNSSLSDVEVGDFDEWISLSDHMPLTASFNLKTII